MLCRASWLLHEISKGQSPPAALAMRHTTNDERFQIHIPGKLWLAHFGGPTFCTHIWRSCRCVRGRMIGLSEYSRESAHYQRY